MQRRHLPYTRFKTIQKLRRAAHYASIAGSYLCHFFGDVDWLFIESKIPRRDKPTNNARTAQTTASAINSGTPYVVTIFAASVGVVVKVEDSQMLKAMEAKDAENEQSPVTCVFKRARWLTSCSYTAKTVAVRMT